MHLSSRTGYAVRALAELARNGRSEPVSVRRICHKQNLPFKYTEQLFRKLKKGGLVKSVHGIHGGYLLNREPDRITLKDIILAVEDDFSYDFCHHKIEKGKHCPSYPCEFHLMWDEVSKGMENLFSRYSLQQFTRNYQEK